jgi:hypothetical protein
MQVKEKILISKIKTIQKKSLKKFNKKNSWHLPKLNQQLLLLKLLHLNKNLKLPLLNQLNRLKDQLLLLRPLPKSLNHKKMRMMKI